MGTRLPLLILAAVLALPVSVAEATGGVAADAVAVQRLAAPWVAAVAARDPAVVDMLSRAGRAYYPRMRELALHANAQRLGKLGMVDQLQAMFLRLMIAPDALRAMSDGELLVFALERGLIGMDLRRSDVLRDVVVVGDEARGRLYKFGRDDRPDRGAQYFVREDGRWRVELRGELERLAADFEAFVERTGLSPSEAAFFVLEMRLMRKVTPADFGPPLAGRGSAAPARTVTARRGKPALRLIAVRTPLSGSSPVAVTVEDREESLRYVLVPGDVLPPYPKYALIRAGNDFAVLCSDAGEIELRLDPAERLLTPRVRHASASSRGSERSLLAHAETGERREGLMAQWRNVGLRDRPLLLQQGSLVPVHRRTGVMTGLRVQRLVDGSFWHQLGMQQGDVITAVNGRPIDSMDAWQHLMEVGQHDLDITIRVERAAKQLGYRTQTIRPR